MKGVFIFNHQNDIVFVKNDKAFDEHIYSVGIAEGLIDTETVSDNSFFFSKKYHRLQSLYSLFLDQYNL